MSDRLLSTVEQNHTLFSVTTPKETHGLSLSNILSQFGTTTDNEELELSIEDTILDNFLSNTQEEILLGKLSKQMNESVEKILNYKHSFFDSLKKLNVSKDNIIGFQNEITQGHIGGSNYCKCVLGHLMTFQKGANWKSSYTTHGKLDPIENFVMDIKFGMNPTNNLKMEALSSWNKEYLNTYF